MINDIAQPSPVYLHSEAEQKLKSAMKTRFNQSQGKTKNFNVSEHRYLSPRNNIRTTNTKNMGQINIFDVQLNNKASLDFSLLNPNMMSGRKISN